MPDPDDAMLRALVQLVESQNERLEAMRQTVVDLQRRLQSRSDMEVLLGHELRTPIGVVGSVVSALRDDVPSDARDELVARAQVQVGYLSDVVDDLLSPSPDNDARVPRSRLRTVALGELVAQATHAAALDGEVEADLDPRFTVATAPARVVAIIVSLLATGARVRSRVGSDGDVVVEISRPDAGPSPASLYLARMLARSLGGDAVLAGRAGGGTVVIVRLPQRRSDDPATAPVVTAPAAPGDGSR